jgi:hypothetical protein
MKFRAIVAAGIVAVVLAGCSTMKSLTGQQDDSVLPGQREDVLSPDQQTARDPVVTGEQPSPDDLAGAPAQQPCNPQIDPSCDSTIDQEATSQ